MFQKKKESKETVVETLDHEIGLEGGEETKASTEPEGEDAATEKVEVEEEAEAEDVKNAEEGIKAVVLEDMIAKKKVEEVVEEEKNDYSLLDLLIGGFLGNDEERLPILCGYFNKIVQSLLTKQKQSTLEYLLIKRKGDIFDLLMNFAQYHSLAILVIELL